MPIAFIASLLRQGPGPEKSQLGTARCLIHRYLKAANIRV
jgi:hypothetical protein